MATVEKILGQSAPGATTSTKIYTVPASTSTVISTITICNKSATATSFRISVSPADSGTGTTDGQYLYFDYPVEGNMTVRLDNLRITLATTDTMYVYNTLATCNFNIFGSERAV